MAAFTTYALSLSFFESVVLDRLVRGRTEQALVLADVEGITAALSEQGAQRAGREYEIEPIVMNKGAVFHPKISFFSDGSETHLLVGSGNLTFGGWGRNLEIIEHLHPSFAGDAFDDAAEFFERLASGLYATHGAQDSCAKIASRLRVAAVSGNRSGSFRLLHSLGLRIGDGIAQIAEDLGGAERLTAAAPYWDTGRGIDDLAAALGLERVHVHAHPTRTVSGTTADCWPRKASTAIEAVQIEDLAGDPRILHGKAFELICRRGRVLVSGSANGTYAALYGGNAEAVVARIQRDATTSWSLLPSKPLPPTERFSDETTECAVRTGVLRADLAGEKLSGRVLTPAMQGAAALYRLTDDGPVGLAPIELSPQGFFAVAVPGLEMEVIQSGRLILRIVQGEVLAEGFASLSVITGLRRFAGKAAGSLLEIIKGTETPEDLIVLLQWAQENAVMLAKPSGSGSGLSASKQDNPSLLHVNDLYKTAAKDAGGDGQGELGPDWLPLYNSLFAALRERRGPIRDESEGDEGKDPTKFGSTTKVDLSDLVAKALSNAMDAMLLPGASAGTAIRAIELMRTICDRRGEKVTGNDIRRWLRTALSAILSEPVDPERIEDMASIALTMSVIQGEEEGPRAARERMMRLGVLLDGPVPARDYSSALLDKLDHQGGFEQIWDAARRTRTWREHARSYVDRLMGDPSTGEFDKLLSKVPHEAQVLENALKSELGRKRVIVLDKWTTTCCRRQLPKMQIANLRQFGVARAANCCQKVLIWPEGANG